MEPREVAEKFSEFFQENYYEEILKALEEGKSSVSVDFSLLEKFDVELADYLLENPEEVIPLAEEGVKKVLDVERDVRVRFFNLPEERNIRIRNLRSEHIGKLVVVDGIVKRASEVRPEVKEAVFMCPVCGTHIVVEQTERTLKPPAQCDCGNRKGFQLVEQKLLDTRWVVIEEPYEVVSGERPSEIMVYLKEDLTSPRMQSKTDPGNRIKVAGILKSMPRKAKGSKSRQMEIYIEANYVEPVEIEWEELEITPEDEEKILELARDPGIYEKLVASIAPSIYGLEDIKLAIALQLFGGVPHVQKDKSRVRGDIHILLVGDPSTAKSALMKVVSTLIPRGRYVSGKGVTMAGLTAAVVRDEEFLGGWVLEAGALVLSNKSLVAIDEFEKIEKTDQVALHEAMESQTISIAKASIVATLPAQTSVLAGGNPKLGRFDPYMPVRDQLSVPETLLSRFDLKFALYDKPNPEVDEKICDHIFNARHGDGGEVKPAIEPELLRKYIAYARKNCFPRMTKEAFEEIKKFYLDLRSKAEEGPIPITTRQLEAMIRLAEASARVRLSDVVTVEDAQRAIYLMKVSLRQFGFDPDLGKLDIDRAEGQKVTAAQRGKIRTVCEIIDELTQTLGKQIPEEEVVKRAKERGVENAEEILRKMLNEGICFSPKPGVIEKL